MNITHRRRGRRSLAAILAAMLMASVLAVVAGSPAHAANTSSEALVDTNDDGVGDAREFGGRDRYDTSLRLAKNFAEGEGGLGSVSVAFVASGHTLVDTVAVSGLAGFMNAPVLLTPADNLHGGVADYIEDYGVASVYVLGGSGAVSDSVLEDMEVLANEPTVTRIQGADRYATAAAIALKLGGASSWCGSDAVSAILVNGGDVSLAEAMMVGPIANRLQLPVLMTAADELPSATADFIESEDIEHVVIVGGTDNVSEGVADAVSNTGVDTITRIAGDTPAATSVALAELTGDDCGDDLGDVSTDTVALVHRDALPDGVSAAAVLANSLDNGNLVPILIVGDTLPASVRDYLAATPSEVTIGNTLVKVDLKIVAIGGTGAVSASVMDAALEAAASADALTVTIAKTDDSTVPPPAGQNQATLYFSDNVIGATAVLTDKIRDAVEVNGSPARFTTEDGLTAISHTADVDSADGCNPDQVILTFANALKPGDVISIAGSTLSIGAGKDRRAVGAASVTVPTPSKDTERPSVAVLAIIGQSTAWVTITGGDPEGTTAIFETDLELDADETDTDLNEVKIISSDTEKTVRRPESVDNLTVAPVLARGDRITVASGALRDTAGNTSQARSFSASAPQKSPRITAVTMSLPNHSNQAAADVPAVLTTFSGDNYAMTITAKKDGAADGAAGNEWIFAFDVASTHDATKDVDIDVRVNSRDKTVSVRFVNGAAKSADLKDALDGNSAFAAMFDVELPENASTPVCGDKENRPLSLLTTVDPVAPRRQGEDTTVTAMGGVTRVAIEARFNGYVRQVHATALLHDIFGATLDRNKVAVRDDNGLRTDAVRLADILDGDHDDSAFEPNVASELNRLLDAHFGIDEDGDEVTENDLPKPVNMVRWELTTRDADHVPLQRDLVTTAAGASAVENDPNTSERETAARAAVAPVATGFAIDDTKTIKVDEMMNSSSQVRIGRSSNVPAPKTPPPAG